MENFKITTEKLKILYLEDSSADAELVIENLLSAGYNAEFDVVISQKEFTEKINKSAYDLILSDYNLPNFDGLGALKIASETCPLVPFICVSGTIGEDIAVELLKQGASDYVLKDRLTRLPYCIQRAISEAKNQAERKNFIEELEESKKRVEASDKLKSTFINNISHEIRTPLNSILGFSSLIAQPNIDDELKNKYYSLIESSSTRLLNTITNYMDISLLASGNLRVINKPFDVHRMLKSLFEEFLPACKGKILDLKLEIPDTGKSLFLNSDMELLRKTLSQFIDNAIKFTLGGEVSFGYQINEGVMIFFVKDTGIGIAKEALFKVFEDFVQEDLLDTRGHEGSGLGLSIAKGLTRLLNGSIKVDSEKGVGTTFWLSIPYEGNLKNISVNEKTDHVSVGGEKYILIAEDDEANMYVLEAILTKAGYKYLTAWNGKMATEECRKHEDIALVLMDVKMPVMDGIEATKVIKSFRNNLPVIAITAFAMSNDEKKLREEGFDNYISKPIKREKLLEIISEYLKKDKV